eukprot:7221029-Lingulodinium_polyedra.AAC.1
MLSNQPQLQRAQQHSGVSQYRAVEKFRLQTMPRDRPRLRQHVRRQPGFQASAVSANVGPECGVSLVVR